MNGIEHRALLEQQALGRQGCVDIDQDLNVQIVGFEQLAKPPDGALNREMVVTLVQIGKVAKHRSVV